MAKPKSMAHGQGRNAHNRDKARYSNTGMTKADIARVAAHVQEDIDFIRPGGSEAAIRRTSHRGYMDIYRAGGVEALPKLGTLEKRTFERYERQRVAWDKKYDHR